MNREEFEAEVLRRAEETEQDDAPLQQALRESPERPSYTQGDVQAVFARTSALRKAAPEKEVPLPLPETPLQRIIEARLLDSARETATETRRALFGSPEPPFSPEDLEGAAAWIEAEVRAASEAQEPSKSDFWSTLSEMRRLGSEVEEATGMRVRVTFDSDVLRFPRPGEYWAASVPVPSDPESPLRVLKEAVRRLVPRTGIPEQQLVAHILAGTALRRPRATIAVTAPWGPVTIRFYVPDLTLKDLKTSYQHIRNAWEGDDQGTPPDRPRRLTESVAEKDQLLVELMREEWGARIGDPPPVPWREVLRMWEERGYGESTCERLRKRWSRIPDKPGIRPGIRPKDSPPEKR